MPDITMCNAWSPQNNMHCPLKETCYRYKATPSEYRQSFFTLAPVVMVHDSASCEYFWAVESKSKFKRLKASVK